MAFIFAWSTNASPLYNLKCKRTVTNFMSDPLLQCSSACKAKLWTWGPLSVDCIFYISICIFLYLYIWLCILHTSPGKHWLLHWMLQGRIKPCIPRNTTLNGTCFFRLLKFHMAHMNGKTYLTRVQCYVTKVVQDGDRKYLLTLKGLSKLHIPKFKFLLCAET